MKRKKAEGSVVLIVLAAVTVIMGLVIFQQIANDVAGTTTVRTVRNVSVTAPTAPAFVDIAGAQDLITSIAIVNNSDGAGIPASNITLVERVGTDGLLTVSLQFIDPKWNAKVINYSMEYGPDGYVESSGGRSLVSLILVFAGLGIAIVALVPTLRSGVLNMIGK